MKKHEFIYDLIIGSNNEIRLGKAISISQEKFPESDFVSIETFIQNNKLIIVLIEKAEKQS